MKNVKTSINTSIFYIKLSYIMLRYIFNTADFYQLRLPAGNLKWSSPSGGHKAELQQLSHTTTLKVREPTSCI